MHRRAVALLSNLPRECHAPAVAVTSKDIARQLKISQSTVSRALRGDPRVAPQTMARVLEAARQMNYTPNLAARSLITRQDGHRRRRRQRHHEPVLSRAARDPPQRVRARRLSDGALQRADGRQRRTARRRPRQRRGGRRRSSTCRRRSASPLPGTRRARRPGRPREPLHRLDVDVDTVVSDNRRGGRLVAEAMVELGHRRIALIAGPENTTTSRDRERGFREQLAGRRASRSTRASGASASSAITAATSGASTSSPPSRGRPPCSPRTTSSRSARSTRRGASASASRPSSRSSASTTSTWRGGRGSA